MSLFAGLTQEQELILACLIFGKSRADTHIANMAGITPAEVRELLYKIRIQLHKADTSKMTGLYHKSVAILAQRKK